MLVALWVVIGIVVKVAGSLKPTPEKIFKYAEKNSLDKIEDPEKRKVVIGRLAEMMNQLEVEDLQDMEEKVDREKREAMFASMTQEEQWFFMEKRMGRAFTQMMEMFNKMERPERKKMVERALREIRKNETNQTQGGGGDGRLSLEEGDPEIVEKVTSAGMKAYFTDASAETKLDLAPLMEEIQKIMSAPGRGPRRKRSK